MAWVAPAIQVAGEVLGGVMGHNSAQAANAANLKNSREQRAWEERLANTSVQRRADDIEKAGFNRVLAATGAGASTPSVSPAPNQPTFDPSWTKGMGASAMLLKEQLLNMRANTANTAAQARVNNVEADIREGLKGKETETRANRFVEQNEWDDLKTSILRTQNISSAAQSKVLTETVNALIAQAKQQAESGKINLEALRNIASMGGIEMGKMQPILKLIGDFILRSEDK
ncbi:DNA pilot protein [Blackfly microvirus SF02]|uniref:DNA pilot protein n=1 Tax=Blackfly microvirus SF02 TaxID=2576452 RepID=A0A4P8PKE1_9VIRU|nr:DNA pilot protein [Blackfly microvirus SF02]